jgi:hypothetical protein
MCLWFLKKSVLKLLDCTVYLMNHSPIPERSRRFTLSSKHWYQVQGPLSLLFNGYHELLPRGYSSWDATMTNHI